MKKIFSIILLSILTVSLLGCGEEKEKNITIKEFKENKELLAEWMEKCRNENGFDEGTTCENAYEADEWLREEELEEYFSR